MAAWFGRGLSLIGYYLLNFDICVFAIEEKAWV